MIDIYLVLKTISLYESMFSVFILFKSFYTSKFPFSVLDTGIKKIADELPSMNRRYFYYLYVVILTAFINTTTWSDYSHLPQVLALPPVTLLITSTNIFKAYYTDTKDKIYHHGKYFICVLISKFINMAIKSEIKLEREVYPFEILQTFDKFVSLKINVIITKIIRALIYDYINYLFG